MSSGDTLKRYPDLVVAIKNVMGASFSKTLCIRNRDPQII
jgi:hypothetical protein